MITKTQQSKNYLGQH